MKLRSSLVGLLLVLGIAAPTAAACMHAAPAGFASHRTPLGAYDVRARSTDTSAANIITSRLALTDPWVEWQRLFSLGAGEPVAPPLTNGVYPVLVVDQCGRTPCLPRGVEGEQDAICGVRGHTAISVLNTAGPDRINEILAHELFHAFQSASAGGSVAETFWVEATAEWGATLLWGYNPESPARDVRFFAHPERSLDDFGNAEVPRDQPYGAWRFVQWAQLHRFATNEPALWRMLVRSFREMSPAALGSGRPEAALRRAWPGFPDALGRFWYYHLEDTTDNGAHARALSWTVGSAGRSGTYPMRHLSARLLKIRLASSVQRVTVKVRTTGGAHQLWLRDGSAHHVTSHTYERTWCSADFPQNFALTDANTSSHPASLRVQVIPRSGSSCNPPACSRAVHAAQTCNPSPTPTPTGASCDSAQAGVYRSKAPDPDGFYTPPYVTFDLICAPTGLELNGFGGLLSDDNCHNVSLGPSGGSVRVGKYLAADGSVDFSYTYSDHQVTGHLQAAGGSAGGTVSVTTPSCRIDYPFNAVWYEH